MKKKRILATIASIIIGINAVPMCSNGVYADDVVVNNDVEQEYDMDSEPILTPIPYRTWDDEKKQLVNAESCVDYIVVSDNTIDFLSNETYVVNSNVKISNRITVYDNVNLILCDGFTLTASKGINVTGSLNIYGQMSDLPGKLIATGTNYEAGIGGNNNKAGGTITINGGNIVAKGGLLSAGIGGGSSGAGGNVTINGGIIEAIGGAGYGSAGIGGGYGARGGNVTINGGIVDAFGNSSGSGIGGAGGGAGGSVIINGGIVNATGGGNSSGIGKGLYAQSSEEGILILGNNVKLEISTNGKNWINSDTGETRTTYMRTSTINIEPTNNKTETDINYIERIESLEEENAKLKEENNNLQRVLTSYGNRAYGDMNDDGFVDARDASLLLTYYAKTSVGYTGTLNDFIQEQDKVEN